MSRKLLLQAAVLDFLSHTGAGDAAELAQKTWGVPPNMPVVRTRNSFLLDWWLQMWKAEEGMVQKGRHASPFPAGGHVGQDSSSDPPSIAGPQQHAGQGNAAAATPRKPSPNASSSQEQVSVSRNVASPAPCLPPLRVDSGHATSTCKHHLESDSSALVTTSPHVGSPLVGSSGAPPPSPRTAEGQPAAQQQQQGEPAQQQPARPSQQQPQPALGPMSPQLQLKARPGRKPARRGVDDPAAAALLARYAAATSQRAPTLAELCERAAARAPRQPAQLRRERQQHAGTDTDTDEAWEEGEEGGAGVPALRPKRMRGGWGRRYTEDDDMAYGEAAEEEGAWEYGYESESGLGSDSKRQRRERLPPGSYARLAAIRFHRRRGAGRPRSAGSLRMQQRRQQEQEQQLADVQLDNQQQEQQAGGCPAAPPAPLADFPDIPEDLLALGDSSCFDLFPGPDMAAVAGLAGWDLAGAAAGGADSGAGTQGSAGVDACCVTVSDLEGVFDDPLDALLPLAGPPGSAALPLAW